MVNVTEERVANIEADITAIIEDIDEFAPPSLDRTNAIASLVQARMYAARALEAAKS
jgi:hypothetical protein